MDYVEQLKKLPKQHDFFIGIDSDGCVFPSMDFKHKKCFCPAVIKHTGMEPVSRIAAETWDFVNLYSKTRGCNRFLAMQYFLKLMSERPEVAANGVQLPDSKELDAWIERESKLGNPALEVEVKSTQNEELKKMLDWSYEVNSRIAGTEHNIGPFPYVIDCLEKANAKADLIVVSQTPLETLVHEWEANDMTQYIEMIAGQEHGKKSEHINFATSGKGYESDKILMIGDAPGDYDAASENNALFFPIVPGGEEASWEELTFTGLERFFAGTYAGEYQQQLMVKFNQALPEKPHWI